MSDEVEPQRVPGLFRRQGREWLYRDAVVRLDKEGVVIRWYYWPAGWKRIPYAAIVNVTRRPLKRWQGQFRVHGIDLRGRWYSRDRTRGEKEMAIDLDLGRRIRPVLTPDEPDKVLEILRGRVAMARGGDAG